MKRIVAIALLSLAWASAAHAQFIMPGSRARVDPPFGGCIYQLAPVTLTNLQAEALQCDSKGNSRHVIMDAAGNARGANVNSSNQLSVSVDGTNAITIASGGVASGAVASGAFASGSIASGAVASGAIASGAFASGSFLNATAGDPCMFQPKTNVAISTASGTTAVVTGVSAKKIYVCSIVVVAPSAVSVSLAEGSSSTCGTSNQAAVIGVATNGTAANGMAFAANGGMTLGNGGGTVAATATNANYLCLFQSGTAQLAGNLTYVQQ